ncbi:TetR/AcrR family transcriptional regulator [Nocardiopsis sp. NPDC058631]|uniref:TetR/AcrR family transcriptional regulator n=1 Tax=Nocardiopsis sp. NPDC058631 TaxID=3346566 RepID=UPI003667EA8A
MAEGPVLPPVVARMWGRDPVSRHGPRPSLRLEGITAAAIGIADAEGLAGVRMSSVARSMGVATMSLYRYVGSKDELLVAMADAAVPAPPEPEGTGWRDYLTVWTRANRDFLLDRPWLLHITSFAPPMGPRSLLWLDRGLAALADTGLGTGERMNVASTLTGYAVSHAGLALGAVGQEPPGEEAVAGLAEYSAILAEVLDPENYPALAAAVGEGAFGGGDDWIDDGDFGFGLDLLLDGIEALIAARRGAHPRTV